MVNPFLPASPRLARPPQTSVQDLMAALSDPRATAEPDYNAMAERLNPPQPERLGGFDGITAKDKWMALMRSGLGQMEAASKPGATFLGSLGAGGNVALSGLDQIRQEEQKRNEQQRLSSIDAFKASMGLATNTRGARMDADKFDYSKTRDAQEMDLQREKMGNDLMLSRERNAIYRDKAEQPKATKIPNTTDFAKNFAERLGMEMTNNGLEIDTPIAPDLRQKIEATTLQNLTAGQDFETAFQQALAGTVGQMSKLKPESKGGWFNGDEYRLPAQPAAAVPGGVSTGIPTIQTQEEFDALPSGSPFIDPDDGKRYRKP